ncbi:MAG: RluA family pseudouridine synthase [Bacteroidetes bacterium]|nr:RluA family pseudouridine synthase [Bacteroidota bacterium]
MTTEKPLQILFEDNHLIIVNKRSGDIVQSDKTGDKPLVDKVKDYIKEKYQKAGDAFLGIPHRIDRPTTGIVIFCRNSRSLERINQMFKEKAIKKTYWAIVKNKPPFDSGKLVHFMKRNEQQNKSYASELEKPGAQRAELDYKIIAQSDRYFLLEIDLQTGRHHQIRAQLSKIGSPIKGDLKYGYERSNEDGSISLHARKVEFLHPSKKEPMFVVASVPEDKLWKHFEESQEGEK